MRIFLAVPETDLVPLPEDKKEAVRVRHTEVSAARLARKPIAGYRTPQPGRLQYPDPDGHHHDDVQDGLDAGGHGDIAIDQPQSHPDYDQRDDQIY